MLYNGFTGVHELMKIQLLEAYNFDRHYDKGTIITNPSSGFLEAVKAAKLSYQIIDEPPVDPPKDKTDLLK